MGYKALYRSYRPTTFKEVVGQKHVIQTLKNAIIDKRTSHAYVFSGLRGIGKTTIARILAKAVNCINPIDGEPCNECENCKAINENLTTDIVELEQQERVREIAQMMSGEQLTDAAINAANLLLSQS